MKRGIWAALFGGAALLSSVAAAKDYANVQSGGSVNTGAAVAGGTASRLLSTDGSGNIQTNVNTQFTGSLVTLKADLSFSSMSVVDAWNPSFGAVTAGSTSTLTWTEVTDRNSEFVTSSFTAVLAGLYEISAEAAAAQTAGVGCLLIKVNAVSVVGGESCTTGVTAVATAQTISVDRILNLAANDIVRIDGSATTANVTFQKMDLTVKRVP